MQSGYTGCLRALEWGSTFDGADIGAPAQILSGKSEAVALKCDTRRGKRREKYRKKESVYKKLMQVDVKPCACFICVMRGLHDVGGSLACE